MKDKNGNKENMSFVSTFNPNNPEVFGVIKQTKHILEKSDKGICAKEETVIGKQMARMEPSAHLTRARFDRHTTDKVVTKCHKGNCGLCEHLIEGKRYKFASQKTFKVNTAMSCDVKNVKYVARMWGKLHR